MYIINICQHVIRLLPGKIQKGERMNDLINTENRTTIEVLLDIDLEGRTTARKLYEFLELNPAVYARWCKTNITDNEFADECVDYWVFNPNVENSLGGRPTQDYKLTSAFAKKLSMAAKNEKGEEAREYFIGVEEGTKKLVSGINELSPELRLLIAMELKQKQQDKELAEVREQNQRTAEQVQGIREVMALNVKSWREDTGNILKRTAMEAGGGTAYGQIRAESYELLESRMAVDLKRRLTNKRRRMAEEGASQSARDKLSYVDVIAEDKKLVEGYVAIVKEIAIKYGTV